MISVLIVDDHAVVRAGLENLLATTDDIALAGSASNGLEAVARYCELEPDVVLMDLSMPTLDGVAATAQIVEIDPDPRVVVLTSLLEDRRMLDALRAGAVGYLLKDAGPEELIGAIRSAAAGDAPARPTRGASAAPQSAGAAAGPPTQRPRGGRAATRRRRIVEQAHRPTPRHLRTHGEGAPHQCLPAPRGDRPDPGRAVGPRAPSGATTP